MKGDPLVLAANTNHRNLDLLTQLLLKEGYQVLGVTNYEEFERALNLPDELDLGLIDVSGFDEHIWEICEQLRASAVPFVVLSPRISKVLEHESREHGAHAVLTKPIAVRELLAMVRSLLNE